MEQRDTHIHLTGELIRNAREARGMSLQDLSDLVGQSPSHISQMEHGTRKIGQDKAYAKVLRCVLFGVSIESQQRKKTKRKVGRPKKVSRETGAK